MRAEPTGPYPDFLLLSGGVVVGIPVGQFQEKLNASGVGGGGGLMLRVNRELPIYAGFELSGFNYDRERDIFLLALDNGDLVSVEMETRTSVFTGHAMMRIAPPTQFFIRPYFDAMMGLKNLFAKTLFFDLGAPNDDPFDRNIEKGDWTFSYGIAAGLQIPIGKSIRGIQFLLDLRCAYQKGAAAEYFVRREDLTGITVEEPIDVFETKNSTTDVLMPHLGVIINFDKNAFSSDSEEAYGQY